MLKIRNMAILICFMVGLLAFPLHSYGEEETPINLKKSADKYLKEARGDFGAKVTKLTDGIMILGAFGAMLGFALVGFRLSWGGWSVDNLRDCKASLIVIIFGVLLALSSKLLAGMVYQAVR